MLDAEGAQRAVAYVVACFPKAGAFLSESNQGALRRHFLGRDRDDVIRSIDMNAETRDDISIKGLLAGIGDAYVERKRMADERAQMARLRLPAPPEPPASHRAKVKVAAHGVYALTVLDLSEPEPPHGRGRRVMTTDQAEEHFRIMMTEEPAALADYVHGLEVEMAKRGKGTLASIVNGLGEVVAQ